MHPVIKRKIRSNLPLIKRVSIGLVLFLAIVFIVFGYRKAHKYGFSFTRIWYIARGQGEGLKETQKRTNILLLGAGGEGHEGGDLTDTLIVASFDSKKRDLVLVAIPRDIWISSVNDKINAVYRFGETKKAGGGMILTKASVEEILGIPIHYGMLVNFSGLTELVDILGGIEVVVEQSFSDSEYPIAGKENDLCGGDPTFRCRYETVTYTQGTEQMDGSKVLKYVRSRHAEGVEGNDFSRSRRQQAILTAFKNKLLRREIITDVTVIRKLLSEINSTLITDLNSGELIETGRVFMNFFQTEIRSFGLTQDEPEKEITGLLINPPVWQYEGKWVLIPKHKDYSQIHAYISCVMNAASECEKFFE